MTTITNLPTYYTLEVETTVPSPVPGDGANVRPAGTKNGAAVVVLYAEPTLAWSFQSAFTTTSDVVAKAAAASGIKNFVTSLQVTNTGVSANDFIVKDGTNVRLRMTVPAGQSLVMDIPLCFPTSAATAINCALGAAGTMQANLIGYTGA